MLFQVYIVDDDEHILKDLEKSFLFIENGFNIAGSNSNPLKAIEEIRTLDLHVIFTDVKMPVINGLELIEKVRGIRPDIEYVVLSSYSDFELVRHSFKLNIFDYLLKPISEEDCNKVLQSLWENLHTKYKTRYDNINYDGTNNKLNEIINYIERNIGQKITLDTLSKQFYLSHNTICQYFSKHMDTTFINYLTKIRMEKARQLLRTDKSIKEIASLCGFKDYFYFCKVFQKHFKCTPTQMRRKEALNVH